MTHRPEQEIPDFVEKKSSEDSATLHLRVLGYKEDGEWCALCLEMDLRGYGATFEDAMKELRNAVVSQFTFAMQMERPELIAFSAEQKYHDIFAGLLRESMEHLLTGVRKPTQNRMIGELPVPAVESLKHGVYATA